MKFLMSRLKSSQCNYTPHNKTTWHQSSMLGICFEMNFREDQPNTLLMCEAEIKEGSWCFTTGPAALAFLFPRDCWALACWSGQ